MDTENQPTSTVRSASDKFQNYYADGEQYVRGNPTKAALVAIGTGFLMAQLPLRFMLLGILKLVLLLVKPATFIYAVSKLFEDIKKPSDQGF